MTADHQAGAPSEPGAGDADLDYLRRELVSAFGPDRVRDHVPLAPLTTFRVGGPADWLVQVREADEIARALTIAAGTGTPVTLLGGGSNILIADRGIRGLVVQVHGGSVRQRTSETVRADAGVRINGLVRWTINRGLAGLERWAGTPGTVGGGIHGNAHFDGRLLGDRVQAAGVADPKGEVREVAASELEFAYDFSRLRRTGEVLLWADFAVRGGNPTELRRAARASLAYRKRTQPLHAASAGCIFQNPDPRRDRLPSGMPATAGALIDGAGLKNRSIGGARVSDIHGNFIVNDGGATAVDIRELIALCARTVEERYGVQLREEIVHLGEW